MPTRGVAQVMRNRSPLALLALVALVLVAAGSGGGVRQVITVSCRDANGRIAPAHAGADGRRIVLGVVSVPPAFIPQVVRYQHDGWRYWSKYGVFVEAGNPLVRLSVPKAWRKRYAIGWGVGAPLSEQRFEPCSPPPTYWNAFAGGFHLNARSACVPLRIQVGERSTTVRFGIGKRCR